MDLAAQLEQGIPQVILGSVRVWRMGGAHSGCAGGLAVYDATAVCAESPPIHPRNWTSLRPRCPQRPWSLVCHLSALNPPTDGRMGLEPEAVAEGRWARVAAFSKVLY